MNQDNDTSDDEDTEGHVARGIVREPSLSGPGRVGGRNVAADDEDDTEGHMSPVVDRGDSMLGSGPRSEDPLR